MQTAKPRQSLTGIVSAGEERVWAALLEASPYLTPRMREMIFADDHSKLIPTAREAVEYLQFDGDPGSQTRATKFNKVDEGGRSDAG